MGLSTPFTALTALAGGALIGLAASLALLLSGRVAGISGIIGGMLQPQTGDICWRGAFLSGMLAGGLGLSSVMPAAFEMNLERSPASLILAGLMVGVGVRLGNGCTSGHGVCGMSRLSSRSLVATGVFMCTGVIAATIVTQFFGGHL